MSTTETTEEREAAMKQRDHNYAEGYIRGMFTRCPDPVDYLDKGVARRSLSDNECSQDFLDGLHDGRNASRVPILPSNRKEERPDVDF